MVLSIAPFLGGGGVPPPQFWGALLTSSPPPELKALLPLSIIHWRLLLTYHSSHRSALHMALHTASAPRPAPSAPRNAYCVAPPKPAVRAPPCEHNARAPQAPHAVDKAGGCPPPQLLAPPDPRPPPQPLALPCWAHMLYQGAGSVGLETWETAPSKAADRGRR